MQNPQLNDNTASLLVMASSTMEKQDHNLALAQAAALRCPRCDSANTKFCYFNNYSLSQPRHFCKACKRYWTRGGTLRNVPVGGGCRKNKRLKRPSVNPSPPSTSGVDNPTHRQFQIIDQIHPLVYKQQSNPPPPPPPPPYDQLSSFTFTASSSSSSPTNGFGYAASSGSSLLGSSGDAILSPAMATLLASTLNNKFSSRVVNRPDSSSINHHNHDFQAMAAFDGLNMKSERQGQECNFNTVTHCSNNNSVASEQIGSDFQSGYWNALWHDPGNIGPSVTSLI